MSSSFLLSCYFLGFVKGERSEFILTLDKCFEDYNGLSIEEHE